jgi:GDP/UDP-N,N'-diacetylbacillosamine 2-epimerase (hydrolysing)
MVMSISVVTATRAEYGLLSGLLKRIQLDAQFNLRLIVTGTHLSPKFGCTFNEILADDLVISTSIPFSLDKDDAEFLTSSLGKALDLFGKEFADNTPDLLIILGDRYEMLAPATAALMQKIPITHIHGGEQTTGAIDNKIRHSITQMADYHMVATKKAEETIKNFGICEKNIHFVGSLGVDKIHKIKFLTASQLEHQLSFCFKKQNILITYHPETLSKTNPVIQVEQLLSILDEFPDVGKIFTLSNADPSGQKVSDRVSRYVSKRDDCYIAKSLGHLHYLSVLSVVDVVVGNSSSGIIEAPTIGTQTLNIGLRQDGREMASTITTVPCESNLIKKALKDCLARVNSLKQTDEYLPYGKGGATDKILEILQCIRKEFNDHV